MRRAVAGVLAVLLAGALVWAVVRSGGNGTPPLPSTSPSPEATDTEIPVVTEDLVDRYVRIDGPDETRAARCDVAADPGPATPDHRLVAEGDSLSLIAGEVYANPAVSFWREILRETNRRAGEGVLTIEGQPYTPIENPDRIFAGDVVALPSLPDIARTEAERSGRLSPLDLASSSETTRSDLTWIGGSSSVTPVVARLADCYFRNGASGTLALGRLGSVEGLEALCFALPGEGKPDILMSSVAINQEDMPAGCRYRRDDLLGLQIANDAVVLAVSGDNASALTLRQNGVTLDQAADLLAGNRSWADGLPINRYFPGAGSGTLAFTSEKVARSELGSAPGIQDSCGGQPLDREDDYMLARCTAEDPQGLAFLPYEAYRAHGDELQAIAVNGLMPVPETIDQPRQNAYPLLRELWLYVPKGKLTDQREVAVVLNSFLRHLNLTAAGEDSLGLTEQQYETTIDIYCEAAGSRCVG